MQCIPLRPQGLHFAQGLPVHTAQRLDKPLQVRGVGPQLVHLLLMPAVSVIVLLLGEVQPLPEHLRQRPHALVGSESCLQPLLGRYQQCPSL